MYLVNGWMRQHGLELVTQKTELVMVTEKIPRIIKMHVGSETIGIKMALIRLNIMVSQCR